MLSKLRRAFAAAVSLMVVTSPLVLADFGAPEGVLIEAETLPPRSASQVVQDVRASGGSAVESSADWQPLFASEAIPHLTDSDSITVWVRHRGGPIQLKTVVEGKQVERKWVWDKPSEWRWSSFGSLSPAELGDGIVVIRGSGAAAVAPAVDCVVLSSDAAAKPAAMRSTTAGPANAAEAGITSHQSGPTDNVPDAAAAPIPVHLTVDWASSIGDITPMHWGIADYAITNPDQYSVPGFNSYMARANPALIRIHHAGLAERWTDAATRRWDAAKIAAAFAAVEPGYGDAKIMLNIPSWPEWLHDGATLPPEKEDAFAALVADLVRVMRDEVGVEVEYWEPLNEKDNNYEKEGRLDDLWRLYNKCAVAIKGVDPQAKVGGLAFTWSKPAWVNAFVEQCGPHIDFVTWHNYATGQLDEANTAIFDKVDRNLVPNAHNVLSALRQKLPNKRVETFLDEYNISWTWQTRDPRMGNNVGAVFQALVVKKLAEAGVTGLTVWHALDNIYGLLSSDGAMRTPAHLFLWGRPLLTGQMAAVTSSNPTAAEALAVTAASGERSVLLIVEAGQRVVLSGGASALGFSDGAKVTAQRIDAETAGPIDFIVSDQELVLPGYSLTLLTEVADSAVTVSP